MKKTLVVTANYRHPWEAMVCDIDSHLDGTHKLTIALFDGRTCTIDAVLVEETFSSDFAAMREIVNFKKYSC